jgi:DNA-binding transcriptional MocR family regulator
MESIALEASGPEIAETMGDWLHNPGPLYSKLVSKIEEAIDRGDLVPGTRLPPERSLALALQISRTTVVTAYAELRDRGRVERRQGSGTWIRHHEHGRPAPYANDEALDSIARNPMMRSATPDGSRSTVDFTVSLQASVGPLIREAMTEAAAKVEALALLSGYQPRGLETLRQSVADYVESTTWMRTSEEQILITTGAQQAIWLLGQLYAPHGENIILENPSYPGAIDAFRMLRARIQPLPADPERLRVEVLHDLIETNHPRLVFVGPTCQAPTGTVMSEADREALVDLVDAHQVTLVEDQTMLPLLIDDGQPAPTALAAISDSAPVITIGSFSKLFWPGLRVGWIRAPRTLTTHLSQFKAVNDMGSSLLSQLIAVQLLERADRMRQIRCAEIASCLDHLEAAFAEFLPGWSWNRPAGGLSFWARLPYGSAERFAQFALLHGVNVIPGSSLTVDGTCDDHVRLQFVQNRDTLVLGVRRLARAWRTFEAQLPLDPRPTLLAASE